MKKKSRQSTQDKQLQPSSIKPWEMKRAPEIKFIDIRHIVQKEFDHDPKFLELYKDFLLGNGTIAATRISINRIQSGFTRINGKITEIVESPPIQPSIVEDFCRMIRAGNRTPIYLYRVFSDNADFVCSDDLALLKAYRQLGIKKVPVHLLNGVPDDLESTALVFRILLCPDSPRLVFEKTIMSNNATVSTLLPIDVINQNVKLFSENWCSYIGKMKQEVENCLTLLRGFHIIEAGQLHYHHCLSSVLCRASRILAAIETLLTVGYTEQALVLLRSLYELALLLHLDWLSPQNVGPLLAASASLTSKVCRGEIKKAEDERITSGWPAKTAQALTKSYSRVFNLIETVSERASISPLRTFHSELYHYLSSASHQDFSAASDYMNAVTSEAIPTLMMPESRIYDIATIVRYANFATAMISSLISSDIGIFHAK